MGTIARMSGYRSKCYLKAMKARTLIINDYKKAFENATHIIACNDFYCARIDEISKLTPWKSIKAGY